MATATAFIVPQTNGKFEKSEVTLAQLQPQEVLVQLKASSICHTDLLVQAGRLPFALPAILGHEAAGIVLDVGTSVVHVKSGDRVVLSYNHCDSCHSCHQNAPWHCERIQQSNFGGSRTDGSQTIEHHDKTAISTCFFGQSSFCNPTVVQSASCILVDSKAPWTVLSSLGCGIQTGAGAVYNVIRPHMPRARHVVILGTGAVGCAAIMMARYLSKQTDSSLKTIIAVDIVASRLEIAKTLGATDVVNSAKTDVGAAVRGIVGEQGVDAVIDCTANLAVIENMVKLVGPGGMAISIGGPPPGQTVSVDVFDLLINAKSYHGCHQGNAQPDQFIPFLIKLFEAGDLPIDKLQTVFEVDQINDAAMAMAKGQVIKPVLLWPEVSI